MEKWYGFVLSWGKKYRTAKDINNLSLIDQQLFRSGSSGEVRVYAFWKDTSNNYNFINGILVLNKEPYQIVEDDGFRWVFPLSLISKIFFSMPEKYSFNIDVRSIKKNTLQENQKQDELQLFDFNDTEHFDLLNNKPTYKGVPQEKSPSLENYESLGRNRKVSANALRIADFKCEFDTNHFTFIRRTQNVPYTEAHHLVPLSYSALFKYSLDIEENIVSLCSTCHNQIHYGKDSAPIIKKLFAERKELLKQAGIILFEQELLSMYELSEFDE
jgi:5-methylcytosine-specific restriction protein A